MHNSKDNKFPLEFNFNIKVTKEITSDLIHINKHLELFYFVFGDASITVDAKEIFVKAGEIAVVPPDSLYSIKIKSEQAIYHNLILDESFYDKLNLINDELCTWQALDDVEAKDCFNKIVAYYKEHKSFYKINILSQVLSLLVLICKINLEKGVPIPTFLDKNKADTVRKAISYIENNYSESISVSELTDLTKTDKFYFCRTFKEITGITPIAYINSYRCRIAQKMLMLDNKGVSQVALSCGFSNLSYFTRTYKKYIGSLPSKTM